MKRGHEINSHQVEQGKLTDMTDLSEKRSFYKCCLRLSSDHKKETERNLPRYR